MSDRILQCGIACITAGFFMYFGSEPKMAYVFKEGCLSLDSKKISHHPAQKHPDVFFLNELSGFTQKNIAKYRIYPIFIKKFKRYM
jgi:hypothetical protein